MTVETDLSAVFEGVLPGANFPDEAPTGTALPYLVYQQAGGVPLAYLERAVPDKKNGRFQVTVWAATRIEAAALMLEAEEALITSTFFQASAIGQLIARHETDGPRYGAQQDFSVWSVR